MLLLSWFTLCVAFWNYKVLWFLIAYFNLSPATHIPDENFFSGNFCSPTEKAPIMLLSWRTLYLSLLVDFHLTLVAQVPCSKLICSWILGAPRKRHRHFSFCGAPIFSIFNKQSVLICDCLFYFVISYSNSTHEMFLFSKFYFSAKEATMLIGYPKKWPESSLILIGHCLQGFFT